MKKGFKILSVIMSLIMILSATMVPTFAATGTTEPKYPNSESFSWGIAGHLATSSYVVEDIEEQIALAAKLGVKVYSVDGNSITPELDKVVKTANAYGMDVMLTITNGVNKTPEEVAKYFGQVARHYASGYFGKVKYIKIFNETDSLCLIDGRSGKNEDAYNTTLVAEMANRIIAANNAIKAVSEDFVTIVNYSWLHDPYLNLLRKNGVDWDVIGLNWYTDMQSEATNGLSTAEQRLNSYNLLKDKKVMITESNVWGGGEAADNDLLKIMEAAYKSDKFIGLCFYELLDEPDMDESESSYGFVNYTNENGIGAVKSKYTTVQGLIGGNNNVVKGEFTPAAGYPSGETTYTKAVTFDNNIALMGGTTNNTPNAGTILFDKAYNMYDFEAFEIDIYVESTGTEPVTYNVLLQNANYQSRKYTLSNIPVNQWVHKVIYIDSFLNYGCDGTDIVRFAVENSNADTIVNVVNASFVTGVSPEVNNTYFEVQKLDYKMLISGTGEWGRTQKYESSVVNMSGYYLEFDVYTASNDPTTKFQLHAYDTSGQKRLIIIEVESNKWIHYVISVSKFGYGSGDMSKITKMHLDSISADKTYLVTNLVLTKDTPDRKTVHQTAETFDLDFTTSSNSTLNGNSRYTISAVNKELGGTYNAKNYLAFEFDVYVESTGTADVPFTFNLKGTTNDSRFYHTGVTIPVNKWVHKVLYIENFQGNGTAVTKVYLDGSWVPDPNTKIRIVNCAFVTTPDAKYENEPVVNFDYTLKGTSSNTLNGNNKYSISANTGLGGTYNLKNYSAYEFDVFVESTGTEDVTVNLGFQNSSNQSFIYFNVTMPVNQWVHKVLYIDQFKNYGHDGTAATKVYFDGNWIPDPNTKVRIVNSALVTSNPKANYVHEPKVTFDFEVKGTSTNTLNGNSKYSISANKNLGDTYNVKNYLAYEFDAYVKSTGTEDVTFNLGFQNSSNQSFIYFNVTIPVNQWVHKVLYIDQFKNYGHDGTAATKVYFDGNWIPDPNTQVRIVNSAFVTVPDAKYVHEPVVTFDMELKGTSSATANDAGTYQIAANKNLGGTYNAKEYLAYEFDAFVESTGNEDVSIKVGFQNSANQSYIHFDVVIPANQWVHKVLYIDQFKNYGHDGTASVKVYFDGKLPQANTQVKIINSAFVNQPTAKYEYIPIVTFDTELKGTSSATANDTGTYQIVANKNLGATYNVNKYLALEFDAFAKSTGTEDVVIKVGFQNSANLSYIYFDVVIPANQWVHKVLYIDQFKNYGHDGTASVKVYFDGKLPQANTEVKLINMALTSEEEPIIWGDANGDGVVNIKDLIRMKKMALEMEGYEYDEEVNFNIDFTVDGMVDAEDLVLMRSYLLGIIDSLEPIE